MLSISPISGRLVAIGLAISIGLITVTVSEGMFFAITGANSNFRDEWENLLLQALIVSIPFLLLAAFGITKRISWVAGIVLTVAFWSYYLLATLSSQDDGTGANIGLGLLMMASPIPISIVCFVVAKR
jgi:hypothetical protein